jgi:Flp pilus assembly pilin Flp
MARGTLLDWIPQLWRREDGQEVIEYGLLLVVIVLACLVVLGTGHASIDGIWHVSGQRLNEGLNAVSSSS